MKIDRPKECSTTLDWLKNNLSMTHETAFRREEVAASIGVPIGIFQKSIHELIVQGYLEYDGKRNGIPSNYRILRDISGITGHQLNQWITDRQRVSDNNRRLKRKQEKRDLTQLRTPQVITSVLELPTTPPVEVVTTQPEPITGEAVLPLSPIQQLLKQAKELAEAEEKRAAEQGPSEELATYDARLSTVEKRVNVMLYFFQQASYAIRSLGPVALPTDTEQPPVVEPAPAPAAEPTTRALLVRLVNSYSAADRKSEHDTWKYLYGQFDLRSGFNAYAEAPNRVKDQSYLSVIEERGQIEPLYEMAKKLLVLPALK